jgi:hypothetical protein
LVDVGEPELAAADQPQRAVARNVAPGEKQVTVGAVAAHIRPAEVQATGIAPHGDRHLPVRRRRITGHRLGGQPGFARNQQRGPLLALGAQGDMNVVVLPGRVRRAGEPGQAGGLDHDGERPEHRRRAPDGTPRRGRCRVLGVGAPQPAQYFGIDVLGPGQGDPHGGGAEVPGGEQATAGALVLQPPAEVHPLLVVAATTAKTRRGETRLTHV